MAVTRNADATYFIPSENEWYKAAYYNPTLNGGYWRLLDLSDEEQHGAGQLFGLWRSTSTTRPTITTAAIPIRRTT